MRECEYLTQDEPEHRFPGFLDYSPLTTLGFALCAAHSMGLNKYVMISTCHYTIIRNSFTALKVFRALPIHPLLPPHKQATTFLLTS